MGRLFAGAVLTAIMIVSTAAFSQVNLTFDKSAVADGVWIGTVAGDVTGRLVTVLVAADQSQPVWDVDFYWIIIADDPTQSFIERLEGTLNSETGAVAMTGSVDDGYQQGASVTEAGQLQDQATMRFTGTIELSAATAAEDMNTYPWSLVNAKRPIITNSVTTGPDAVPDVCDPYPFADYPWPYGPSCTVEAR